MALTSAQNILLACSQTPGVSQQFGVPAIQGNGLIVAVQFGDTTSAITSCGDQNAAYTLAQGPNRLASSTTYCFYLPVVHSSAAILNVTLVFSNPVPSLIIGLSEYVAPNATELITQAQSDVPTQLSNIQALIRAKTTGV